MNTRDTTEPAESTERRNSIKRKGGLSEKGRLKFNQLWNNDLDYGLHQSPKLVKARVITGAQLSTSSASDSDSVSAPMAAGPSGPV